MFVKRHYEVIAKILLSERLTREDFVNPYNERAQGVADGINVTLEAVGTKLADCFEKDNQLFNRDKFLEACGIN